MTTDEVIDQVRGELFPGLTAADARAREMTNDEWRAYSERIRAGLAAESRRRNADRRRRNRDAFERDKAARVREFQEAEAARAARDADTTPAAEIDGPTYYRDCAKCAGRIMARGCKIPDPRPAWADRPGPFGTCVVCEPEGGGR